MPGAKIKIKHDETGEEREFTPGEYTKFKKTVAGSDGQWRVMESTHTDTTSLYIRSLEGQIKQLQADLDNAQRSARSFSDTHAGFISTLLGTLAGWSVETQVVYPPGVDARRIIDAAMTVSRKTDTPLEKTTLAMLEVFGVEVKGSPWENDGYDPDDPDF